MHLRHQSPEFWAEEVAAAAAFLGLCVLIVAICTVLA
jgi:hypothetical protein